MDPPINLPKLISEKIAFYYNFQNWKIWQSKQRKLLEEYEKKIFYMDHNLRWNDVKLKDAAAVCWNMPYQNQGYYQVVTKLYVYPYENPPPQFVSMRPLYRKYIYNFTRRCNKPVVPNNIPRYYYSSGCECRYKFCQNPDQCPSIHHYKIN